MNFISFEFKTIYIIFGLELFLTEWYNKKLSVCREYLVFEFHKEILLEYYFFKK